MVGIKIVSTYLIYMAFCSMVLKANRCGRANSIYGKMLHGSVFKELSINTPYLCQQICDTETICQSFNYNVNRQICELNSRTKEASPNDFVPDQERLYMTRYKNRVPLGSISELPAESCNDIKANEGGHVVSGKYWIRVQTASSSQMALTYCNMENGDMDECNTFSGLCHADSVCENTVGSFTCTCNTGFTGDGRFCVDADECSLSVSVCHEEAICQNTVGSFTCACKVGYSGDGLTCADADECSSSNSVCHADANCQNTVGSFTCACKVGYSGDGLTCADVDECSSSNSVCHADANCQNIAGSFTCTCKAGYSGDGLTCADVDECSQGSHDCLPNLASCTNTAGSYSCACNAGYVGDGKTSCELTVLLECQNYQTLTSADRKTSYTTLSAKCDSSLGPGWFRFQGAAGTRMPTSCPPTLKCDTHATGWLNGAHPTKAHGKVTRQVCFHWSGSCCYWSTNIQVINCGSYHVYYLSGTPNACSLRYCGTD